MKALRLRLFTLDGKWGENKLWVYWINSSECFMQRNFILLLIVIRCANKWLLLEVGRLSKEHIIDSPQLADSYSWNTHGNIKKQTQHVFVFFKCQGIINNWIFYVCFSSAVYVGYLNHEYIEASSVLKWCLEKVTTDRIVRKQYVCLSEDITAILSAQVRDLAPH